jgi:hypothetical protein
MDSRLPDHPSDLDKRPLPLETVGAGRELFGIHLTTLTPKFFGQSGTWRFDAPDKSFGTLYAALTPEAAFAEALFRGPGSVVSQTEIEIRSLCRLTLTRVLRLVRLHGPSLSRLGATAAVTSGPYATSQRWSRALHSHPESPDGILYRATHDNDQFSVAIFHRAEGGIDCGTTAPLLSDANLLGQILDHYGASLR